MFGIFKAGIKLGVGCFVAGILFVLLLAAAWYYFFGRKPEPHARNGNRRAAILRLDRRAADVSARPLLKDGDGCFGV